MNIHVNVSLELGDDEEVSEGEAVERLRGTLQDLARIERRALVGIYKEALAARAQVEKQAKVEEKGDRSRLTHGHGKKFC